MNGDNIWSNNLISIIEEFQDCFDSMERYELLFDYAKKHPTPLPPEDWNDSNKIIGCQSRAHVSCNLDEDGNFVLRGGADAQIVQGLMSITAIAVNGMAPDSVSKMTPNYAEEMGLQSSLTPSRANGFLNMFRRVQEEATKLVK
ncbi:MAG: SufE family protein [Candidatus Poseidoniales archaeon]|jgi:cysteine desulfuration protein SufE|tara:strand:- start:107 stop:538 length:432 start_codon:yes stop_codon:yes gene_type:complete